MTEELPEGPIIKLEQLCAVLQPYPSVEVLLAHEYWANHIYVLGRRVFQFDVSTEFERKCEEAIRGCISDDFSAARYRATQFVALYKLFYPE